MAAMSLSTLQALFRASVTIKEACTRWGVVQHRSGFGLDLALVILALVWLVWCVVTVL